jgi:DNA-binding NarL/FixJ family response regulator
MAVLLSDIPPKKAVAAEITLRRALVVDDSPTILHAVCSLLEHHQVVNVVGRSDNASDAIDAIQLFKPELLLMDADMPGMSGLRASLVMSQLYPEVTIVLMSMDKERRFIQACHDCGARAVIYKPKFLKELDEFLKSEDAETMKPITGLKNAAQVSRPV